MLHNPANDRRTTAGVFHIAEGGLPIPDDKIAVPKAAFARLLARAFEPPEIDKVLPYTANQAQPAACFVSLQLRPLVAPEVPGSVREKRMETRFIVPGGTRREPRLRRGHLRQRRATPTSPRTTRPWPRRPGPATPAASSSRRT